MFVIRQLLYVVVFLFFMWHDSRKLTICCSYRGGERAPDHSHVGGQHSTEAAGGKVQKRGPASDPVQGHIWCVWDIYLYYSSTLKRSFVTTQLNTASYMFSLVDAFSQIIANEGVGTLWNGTLPSLILVLNPAVQFMFYEAMKRKAGKGGRKVRGHEKYTVVKYTTYIRTRCFYFKIML